MIKHNDRVLGVLYLILMSLIVTIIAISLIGA
jgi:hypothetical protein